MILQALVQHYEDLAALGEAQRPGWGPTKVSYALKLSDDGEVIGVMSVLEAQTQGKKEVLRPRIMAVPAPVKRSMGIMPNFLCDNSGYILGVDNKEKPQRALDCFAACKALHETVLAGVDSPAAKAVLGFFQTWEPGMAAQHPALSEYLDDLIGGANLIFMHNGRYVCDDSAIRAAWQSYYDRPANSVEAVCLVTGSKGPIAQLHPAIKGVRNAQSSGASLVSFNAPSFCSYEHEQGQNAPTGAYAAFAYGTALNHLVADRAHNCYIGDTLVLCWASGGESAFQSAFGAFAFGTASHYSESDLQKMVQSLCAGQPVLFDGTRLDPDREFYVLGIAPNAARLSVRFFLRNSFGAFLQNVQAHHQRLEIVRPSYDKFPTLSLWKLLDETVNQNSRDKSPSPVLAGELLRSILTDARYPATLLNGVTLRIRAEHEITRGRAAILKAYYWKNPHPDVPKEVLTVSLNPESSSVPYQLGRLFSVLEDIQSKANPGINATIKDKYFGSASATPALVFPTLVNLAQKHLKKLDKGLQVTYNKQLQDILDHLQEEYPARMNLPQQGAFQLGYYHQTQARYQPKNQ